LLDRSGLEVVGQVGDATELIEVVRQQRPELAVVHIRMPPKHATEGLDAARSTPYMFHRVRYGRRDGLDDGGHVREITNLNGASGSAFLTDVWSM
jgi:hypothetical protein